MVPLRARLVHVVQSVHCWEQSRRTSAAACRHRAGLRLSVAAARAAQGPPSLKATMAHLACLALGVLVGVQRAQAPSCIVLTTPVTLYNWTAQHCRSVRASGFPVSVSVAASLSDGAPDTAVVRSSRTGETSLTPPSARGSTARAVSVFCPFPPFAYKMSPCCH